MYLEQGGEVFKLSREMGHSTIQVTETYLKDFRSTEARREHTAFSPISQLDLEPDQTIWQTKQKPKIKVLWGSPGAGPQETFQKRPKKRVFGAVLLSTTPCFLALRIPEKFGRFYGNVWPI